MDPVPRGNLQPFPFASDAGTQHALPPDGRLSSMPTTQFVKREPFELAGYHIAPGTSETIDIPVSRLSTDTDVGLRVRVLHGKRPGPVLFVSGSVHGDEIMGVEIIRRLLKAVNPKRLSGTLLCIPIVNAYGFVAHQRYLPDRRDLNRCFPGSISGSLAAQLADRFTQEIIARISCLNHHCWYWFHWYLDWKRGCWCSYSIGCHLGCWCFRHCWRFSHLHLPCHSPCCRCHCRYCVEGQDVQGCYRR